MKTFYISIFIVLISTGIYAQKPLNIWSSGEIGTYFEDIYDIGNNDNMFNTDYPNGNFMLPVSWISAEGICDETAFSVEWKVASEENLAGYEIELYTGNGTWEYIDWYSASGSLNVEKTYNYILDTKLYHSEYLRITPVDFDGKRNDSRILSINCSGGQSELFSKPALAVEGNDLLITVNSTININSFLSIFDMQGRLINRVSFTAIEGQNSIRVPWDAASQKIIVRVETPGFSTSEKFFVQ